MTLHSHSGFRRIVAAIALCGAGGLPLHADDQTDFFKPTSKTPDKPVAGKAEMLRHMPKKFATFLTADEAAGQVTLLIEGEKESKPWPINPDAEIKVRGWWGRLSHLAKGQRVWVWFAVDREKKPKSVLMLADEVSQQDILGVPAVLEAVMPDGTGVRLREGKKTRELQAGSVTNPDGGLRFTNSLSYTGGGPPLRLGETVYVQTAGSEALCVLSAVQFEDMRRQQKEALRLRWIDDGLPGTVAFLHPLAGEFEYMLDHEGIRWGRWLKTGDKVTLKTGNPIEAVVKDVSPWREKTRLRLIADGFLQSELALGQRVRLHMNTPPASVDESEYPPDLNRPRSRPERLDWFLASTYCSCNVRGSTCTGMFYTLASCNVNACGMPNAIRDRVAALIDKGLTDKQIWDELKKSQGPLMLKPHLLP